MTNEILFLKSQSNINHSVYNKSQKENLHRTIF